MATSIANRKSSALAKEKAEVSKYRAKLSGLKRSYKESRVPSALMASGSVLAGAAAAGALQSSMPTMGQGNGAIPSPVVAGLVLMGAGAALGGNWGPMFITASSGMLAGYVQAQIYNGMQTAQAARVQNGNGAAV